MCNLHIYTALLQCERCRDMALPRTPRHEKDIVVRCIAGGHAAVARLKRIAGRRCRNPQASHWGRMTRSASSRSPSCCTDSTGPMRRPECAPAPLWVACRAIEVLAQAGFGTESGAHDRCIDHSLARIHRAGGKLCPTGARTGQPPGARRLRGVRRIPIMVGCP